MVITTSVVGRTIPDVIGRQRHAAMRHIRRGVENIVELGEQIARQIAPDGVTGNYSRKLGHSVSEAGDRVIGQAGNDAPHAHLVERGRRPGPMPPAALMADVFDVPYAEGFAIAMAIAHRGTRGHHVLERTHSMLRPTVTRIRTRILADIGRLG